MDSLPSYNIEFDLFKLKGIDVFDMFKKKIENKLRELNIKYDIKLIDENEPVMTGGGQNDETYPYNIFKKNIDSIVGIKSENAKERESWFKDLFSTPVKSSESNEKKQGFFDMFTSSNNSKETTLSALQPSVKKDESINKNKESGLDISKSELFKIKKTVVKTPTIEEPSIKEDKSPEEVTALGDSTINEPTITHDNPIEEEDVTVLGDPTIKEEDQQKEEVTAVEKDETELISDFVKTQTYFIKVVVSIYDDDKNEKVLPAKIGIKKWLFN